MSFLLYFVLPVVTFPAETLLRCPTCYLRIHASLCLVHHLPMFLGHDREIERAIMGNRRAPAVLEPRTQRQAVILIVEDDPGIGYLLLTIVRQETPYDALLASDGETALRLLATQTPHLVIVDYQLPG